jgi:hypothetical protein
VHTYEGHTGVVRHIVCMCQDVAGSMSLASMCACCSCGVDDACARPLCTQAVLSESLFVSAANDKYVYVGSEVLRLLSLLTACLLSRHTFWSLITALTEHIYATSQQIYASS